MAKQHSASPACMSLYICSWLHHGTQSIATKQTTGPVTEKAEGSEEWEAPNLFSRRGMIGQDELQSYVHYLLACHLAVSPFWVVSRGGSSDQARAEKHRQFFHLKNGNNNPPLHESFKN
ncbi:uncharacterized protein LOC115835176 isoform X3 [Nomascus leucogenys]|uniref:uncharacterized protein LOC115835176 isoform X3 n=1 Tax=Nomascus leucogenys TaxID=61853 RepID=UPI00122D8952|nr:uncharacterized protein LOC115835176 isoform X3 [Nomascus leucogenys]